MSPRFSDRGAGGGREARSAQAREQARLERERRRAARDGHDPVAPAHEWTPERIREPDPEPPPAEPPRPLPPPPVREPDPDPEPYREPEGEPAVRVLGRESDPDRPLGTRRVGATALVSSAGAGGPPRFGAPPRGTPRARRGMRRIIPAVLIIVLLVVGYAVNEVLQPFHGEGTGAVRVVIPAGSGARQIGDQLARAGVVDSGLIFSLRARVSGDRDKLRSGPHVLKRDMSYAAVLSALIQAPRVAATVNLAIPEGLTIRQIGSLAHRTQLKGSYTQATTGPDVRRRARPLGIPSGVRSLEGFMFPATYQLRRDAPTATLVADQLRSFRRQTAGLDYTYAKQQQLTRYDVLIIASLVESEAQVPKDRPLIAAVIYNRLKQGIPLFIDATTRYETGNYGDKGRPIRQSELDAATPYNTRKRTGLPPTPISNPGLASLRAAARPAKVSYLYYVVKPCGHGAHSFSSTDAAFQQDRAAYDHKRAQLGGKDPSTC